MGTPTLTALAPLMDIDDDSLLIFDFCEWYHVLFTST